jgi:hypothetical protein
MQVKPIAGCGWKWFYQQLQSLHAAGDGLVRHPLAPRLAPQAGRLPPLAPRGTGLVGCYKPTAARPRS